MERWQFDIHTDEAAAAGGQASAPTQPDGKKAKVKTEKEVQGEIREIMKQITSSVTFLPILDEPCEWLPHALNVRGEKRRDSHRGCE